MKAAKARYPEAVFMAHPECPPEVVALADVSVSTSGMIRHAQQSSAATFIVGTEVGMQYPLEKACPGKTFHMVSPRMHCDDMKKISLDDIVRCLETMQNEVKVPEDIRLPALEAVQRMVEMSI